MGFLKSPCSWRIYPTLSGTSTSNPIISGTSYLASACSRRPRSHECARPPFDRARFETALRQLAEVANSEMRHFRSARRQSGRVSPQPESRARSGGVRIPLPLLPDARIRAAGRANMRYDMHNLAMTSCSAGAEEILR